MLCSSEGKTAKSLKKQLLVQLIYVELLKYDADVSGTVVSYWGLLTWRAFGGFDGKQYVSFHLLPKLGGGRWSMLCS